MTRTLESLEKEREQLLQRLQEIDEQIGELRKRETANNASQLPSINKFSTVEDKINLYRSLFRGRKDVFAKRFERAQTGKCG